jgi:hypothetical protein
MTKVQRYRPEYVMVRHIVLGRRAGLRAEVPCMKTRLFRMVEILLNVAILALAVHLSLILYFAGYSLSLSFVTIQAQNAAPPTILLMALILLRVAMRCCMSSGKNLSASMPTIFFCVFMILYLANGVTKWTGDTLPARYLPFSTLREGIFDLNEFPFLYAHGLPYYFHISTVTTFQMTPWDLPSQPCPFTSFQLWELFPLLTNSSKTLKNSLQRLWWLFRPVSSILSSGTWRAGEFPSSP